MQQLSKLFHRPVGLPAKRQDTSVIAPRRGSVLGVCLLDSRRGPGEQLRFLRGSRSGLTKNSFRLWNSARLTASTKWFTPSARSPAEMKRTFGVSSRAATWRKPWTRELPPAYRVPSPQKPHPTGDRLFPVSLSASPFGWMRPIRVWKPHPGGPPLGFLVGWRTRTQNVRWLFTRFEVFRSDPPYVPSQTCWMASFLQSRPPADGVPLRAADNL